MKPPIRRKKGRPLVEGAPREARINVRITTDTATQIDEQRGSTPRSEWVRRLIKKELG